LQITYLINAISTCHKSSFDVSVDDHATFGWPLSDDYEATLGPMTVSNIIRKATLKDFAPDPVS